jgi:tetratricopeptide (TPR) repeat protein
MSLLIKALDKAEKAQVEQQKLEQAALDIQQASRRRAKNIANDQLAMEEATPLTLADTEPEPAQSSPSFVSTQYSGEHTSERASNMFASKAVTGNQVKPIVWIVAFGVLAFLIIVGYFYYQLNAVNVPAIPTSPSAPFTGSVQTDNATGVALATSTLPAATDANSSPILPTEQSASATLQAQNSAELATEIEPRANQTVDVRKPVSASRIVSATEMAKSTPVEVTRYVQPLVVPTIASESASIQISRNQPAPAVSPILMSAYNAYLAGNDSEAQALYKRVLQREYRNVDAMLGLGAIAERQGRIDDAFGWYQKVLELDPRNAVALSAFANNVQDDQSKALKLKNMLAENPNDANVHASLAAHYAEQSRWSEAQQSYFEAYRLSATAENAFNLAVSLDQMGKPKLALPYYQQALGLLASSPSMVIDVATLQARITAIQSQ